MPASEGMAGALVEIGRRCSPTKSVLAEWARRGTPRQVEFPPSHLKVEAQSRDAPKRASPLCRCALPTLRTFDGHDWGGVSWPQEFGRDDLLSLSFMHGKEDLALMGDAGCGNYVGAGIMPGLGRRRRW